MKLAKCHPEKFASCGFSDFYMIRILFLSALFMVGFMPVSNAQENEFGRSSWWFGVAGGANNNLYHGGNPLHPGSGVTIPDNGYFTGKGTGYFAFPVLEYHPEDKNWGFFLQAGYDNRKGTFQNELTTEIAYVTLEPAIRFNFLKTPFYLYAGPRFAVNTDKRFTYQQQSGTLDNMKTSVLGFQVGAGYDIYLTSKEKKSQAILAPFFSFQPYFGQSPRTTDTWNITTIRAGIALKFGRSHQFAESRQVVVPVSIVDKTGSTAVFNEPPTVQQESLVDKTGPLGNKVFFDLSASKITNQGEKLDHRNIRHLEKQMKGFAEEENLSAEMHQKMMVDNNFLTTLGEQMLKDPSSTVTLVGSSKNGAGYGEQLAKSIKLFLTGVFGIHESRVQTKGHKKLRTHSGKQRDHEDLALLFEKDRQVLIKSKSTNLQKSFRGNSGESLAPLEMKVVHEPNVDGYVTFSTSGLPEKFASWSLKIADGGGMAQNYGPFTGDTARILKRKILGESTVGDYKVTISGQLTDGKTLSKDTTVLFRTYPLTVGKKYTRFAISYEFNGLQSISDFKRYLTNVVAPEIPENANVVIHGHANTVEDQYFDLKRFLAQANDARDIIREALVKAGKTNVQFEVYGLGQDQVVEPFRKSGTEKKHYYRTLIVDVVPPAK